jgi:hypothetical protein
MVLRGATSLRGALEGVDPENRDFFGPWNGTSEASAIWAPKSHKNNKYINSYILMHVLYVSGHQTFFDLISRNVSNSNSWKES